MRNINLFQYLAAFVSIVLAIAVSDMLMSLHRLLVARRYVTWRALPLAVALYVFLMILSEFFSLWVNANVAEVSFLYLVLLVSVSSVSVLAALAALPDGVPESGIDLGTHYNEQRLYLFAMLAVGLLGDQIRTGYLTVTIDGRMPWADSHWLLNMALVAANVGLYGVLAWARSTWVQVAALVLSYALVLMNFIHWTVR